MMPKCQVQKLEGHTHLFGISKQLFSKFSFDKHYFRNIKLDFEDLLNYVPDR